VHALSAAIFRVTAGIDSQQVVIHQELSGADRRQVRAAVLAQDPIKIFENWHLMIGDGLHNIWIYNANEGLERYQIITINDGR
jgi:hypothetical protein